MSKQPTPLSPHHKNPAPPHPHQQEALADVRAVYNAGLHPDLAIQTFRNIDRLFPCNVVPPAPTPRELPAGPRSITDLVFESRGRSWDLWDYLSVNRVAGLLVLHQGAIAYETYQYGNTPQTRWMSMSVAKSVTSTLVGCAVQQGLIGSLHDPVTHYLPHLKDSAYDDVTLHHVLTMCSGVQWNETYTDPRSDRRRLLEAQLQQRAGSLLELMARQPRVAPPGEVHCYNTGETQIAAEVLRSACQMSLASYLHERIWRPCGAEAPATWWLEAPEGCEIGGSGLAATLRDYGRFGLFCLEDGRVGGEAFLPEGWMRTAGAPSVLANGQRLGYGYFWWPCEATPHTPDSEGAFAAEGIFGQYIYLHPTAQVVVVAWGARSKPNGNDIIDDHDFCAALVRALRPSC